ncbi:MAG: hypothetical protein V1685_01415, partial [Parcubacteria group bacterium]
MAYFKQKQNHLIRAFPLVLVLAVFFFMHAGSELAAQVSDNATTEEYQELNKQIEEKKLLIDEINQKIEQYEESLDVKRQEALLIQGQLTLLDSQITQTNADIERIKLESDRARLEIERLTLDIEKSREMLGMLKGQLSEYIRQLNISDGHDMLAVFLTNSSISGYFDYVKSLEDIETTISKNLTSLKDAKQELEEEQNVQSKKKEELSNLEGKLTLSIGDLESQQTYKLTLLDQTKESQEVFEDLLEEAQLDQKQINSEIYTIEQNVRDKLREGGDDLLDSNATLSWPVMSHNGISAYFQDPTYPYRKYFEHPAIHTNPDPIILKSSSKLVTCKL